MWNIIFSYTENPVNTAKLDEVQAKIGQKDTDQ